MKKILVAIILIMVSSLSCTAKKITEMEFSAIWREYLRIEFEESFDEKQSVQQREKILENLLSKYDIAMEEFKNFMEENHKEKYNKIFF